MGGIFDRTFVGADRGHTTSMDTLLDQLRLAQKLIATVPEPRRFDAILSHPDNMPNVQECAGIPVFRSRNTPKYAQKYVWPKFRFIEYDDSDIHWGQAAGIGYFSDDESTRVVWTFRNPEIANPFFGEFIIGEPP